LEPTARGGLKISNSLTKKKKEESLKFYDHGIDWSSYSRHDASSAT
jgi:hypothetical protein